MIDIHIHAVPPNLPGTGSLAPLLSRSDDEILAELKKQMHESGVSHALAMGQWAAGRNDPLGVNRTLALARRMHGLFAIGVADPTRTDEEHFRLCEDVLATGSVVALKGYLGYLHFEPAHANYRRYYELAAKYQLPFLFHTGDTYSPYAKLKYAHPIGVDEVAVDHPDVRFVICHIGNPWTVDCAEVVYKNMNVWADLSGLIVGDESVFATEEGQETAAELAYDIQRTIQYSERPNRFLYGTDWPLVPMLPYRDFIREAVPVEYHDLVFEENARRLFRLG